MATLPPPPGAPVKPSRPLMAMRCARHPAREAVARCPECGQSFCRECISEHDGRILCANCLAKVIARETRKKSKSKHRFAWVRVAFTSGISALALWLTFFLLGKALVSIPPSFHEGTVWQNAIERSQPSP